jgi:hypothetical protein
VIFKNNLNGFWYFYHGTTLGGGSHKALSEASLWPYQIQAMLNMDSKTLI